MCIYLKGGKEIILYYDRIKILLRIISVYYRILLVILYLYRANVITFNNQ